MAATSKAYGNFALHLAKGRVNWLASGGSAVKCALLANTYSPDQDAHATWADVLAHEVSGTGYTAGGAALVLTDASYDSATNTLTLDAADAEWSSLSLTARYAVIYIDGATDATSWLVAYTDFGVDKAPLEEPLKVIFNAAGIITMTVA